MKWNNIVINENTILTQEQLDEFQFWNQFIADRYEKIQASTTIFDNGVWTCYKKWKIHSAYDHYDCKVCNQKANIYCINFRLELKEIHLCEKCWEKDTRFKKRQQKMIQLSIFDL